MKCARQGEYMRLLTSRGDDLRSWLASATLVQLVAHMYRQQTAAGRTGA